MTKTVRSKARHAVIGGRCLVELIRGILETRVSFVANYIDAESILASLLEEHFYGGSFKDDFYESLSTYCIPTDVITLTRKEILKSISEQVEIAFGNLNSRNLYSFRFIAGGDVMITESTPWPVYGEHIFGGDLCTSSSPFMTFGDATPSKA